LSDIDARESVGVTSATVMDAIRLHPPGTIEALALERIGIPRVGAGEALMRVHAAAITRGELEWPADRLPAIPSYELSGTIAARASTASDLAVGDPVWALTGFDRDGGAAEYALVPVAFLAPKPRTLGHVASAATPLAGLTAWQGLFEHGRLRAGERVLIHGAAGGVGQFATQLARWRGAYVIGTSSAAAAGDVLALGGNEAVDRTAVRSDEAVAAVDLVFDTVGGEALARSPGLLREGGRVVSVAEEPPAAVSEMVKASYFVVEPRRAQLIELARLVDEGRVRPLVDAVFPLAEARAAFERVAMTAKRGKVVLRVAADEAAGG
jgi:NADPH:quinone reductase-like Zn-dependent oxidoreductase